MPDSPLQAEDFQNVILTCVFEQLVDSESCQLREMSSACAAEFFHWSVKQARPKAILTDTALGVSNILRRIYELAIHPGRHQRLGGAKIARLIARVRQLRDHLWTVSHASLSSMPPHRLYIACSTWCPCVSGADWCL